MPRSGGRRDQNRSISGRHESFGVDILELPDDVLFLILGQCDIRSLGRLSRVCRRINRLIKSDSVWLKHSKQFPILKTADGNDTNRRSLKERLRLSQNWVNKYFRERVLLRHNPKQLPWMQYLNQTLWVSTKSTIKCYNVKYDGLVQEDVSRRLLLPSDKHDVSRFAVKENWAVSGCRDGSLYVYDSNSGHMLFDFHKVHNTDTQTVDLHSNCIVSGSRDRTIKIISTLYEDNGNHIRASIDMADRVWSVAIAPDGSTFTVGTAGCYGTPSVSVWDIETGAMVLPLGTYRHGAGTLDMKYETPHTLLTCGYDSNLRMWDTRCGQSVLEWEEPFDTTLYCLQSDCDVTMVTGTARYGMIRLWDKRKRQPTQMYYLGTKNSPVYSVAFDSSRLYAALDLSITMADFSILPP